MTLSDFRLSRRQRRTLTQLCPIVCPRDIVGFGISGVVVDDFERLLRSFPALVRFAFSTALILFEWLPVILPSSIGRSFSSLPHAAQERYFAGWWHSRIQPVRLLCKTMKGLLTLAYYDQPVVRRQLEYAPDEWMAEVKQKRLDRFSDEIREHEAAVTAPDPLVTLGTPSGNGRHGKPA